ncbi:MAG: ATP-dependent helicase [Burkholderiales bacterium]|nr:ATP-dependent helicase [Burkholderiales bacterium]
MPALARAPAAARGDDPFADLNAEQRAAVEHGIGADAAPPLLPGGPAPLLLVAGAGSGKTNTLAHRVARLIVAGADAQRLLLLTFSRRAAQEMERRAGRVVARVLGRRDGADAPALPWAGTFHGIGARLLREYAPRIGLAPGFTIHDRGDAEDLMGLTRLELGLAETAKRFPHKGTCLAIYSRVVNTCASLEQVLQSAYPWCAEWQAPLKRLFGAYVEAKAAQNVLDYDDLLLFWAGMLEDAGLAAEIGERFDHVLVDEYQDTNRLQAAILKRLKPDGRGLMVVGDDAQAIYSFRGATVRNILDFPAEFGAARVLTLERNYRSTRPILDASNTLIGRAAERHAKALWTDRGGTRAPQLVAVPDEAAQARWVAERVLEEREGGLALKAQAVLFRTASHSAALELELARRDIPFVKFGGLKFLEAAHIKDLLAILRMAENPQGRIAGLRVLRLIPGVGPVTAARVLDRLDTAADPGAALATFLPPGAVAPQEWQDFVAMFAALRAARAWPADLEAARAWYLPQLERLYDDAGARRADLDQLSALAAGYASRERFLTELTLDPPEATSDRSDRTHRDDDYLVLSTIHSAKGQEWTAVHVLNVVDGCIPSDMAVGTREEIEEERRLLYVAMTRAKERLHLVVPQRFYVTQQAVRGDRHVYAARSRFIADADLGRYEQLAWPPAPASGLPAAPGGPVLDIRRQARAAWA